MSWLSDLLTGTSSSLDVKSLPTTNTSQQEALTELLARLRQPVTMTSGEQASLTALEQRSQALAQPADETETLKTLLDYEGQTQDTSERFRTNVQEPLLDSFQREILPSISRSFGGNDFFSTERQDAEGLARQDLLNSLAGQRTEMEYQSGESARNRALQASGLLQSGESSRTQSMIDILTALGTPREAQNQQDQLLAQASLTPTIENVAQSDPGTAGLLSTLLAGIAAGTGEDAGNWLSETLGNLLTGDSANTGTTAQTAEETAATGAANTTGTNEWITEQLANIATPALETFDAAPTGTATITDANGQPVAQETNPLNSSGSSSIGTAAATGATAGVGAALAGAAPAGSAIITEAGGALASQIAAGGAGAAAGAGAAGTGSAAGGTGAAGAGAGVGALGTAGIIGAGFAIAEVLNSALGVGNKGDRLEQFYREAGIERIQVGRNPEAFFRLPSGNLIQGNQQIDQLYQLAKNWATPEGRIAYENYLSNLESIAASNPRQSDWQRTYPRASSTLAPNTTIPTIIRGGTAAQ